MAQDWKSAPAAKQVLDLADDPRPAWLWAGHGGGLLWSNRASALFGARLKASGLKLADSPTPIKGQITRIMRLGLLGHATLSRMQFLAGRKPLSATCRCTPLDLGEEHPVLLVVGVDPIDSSILERARANGMAGFDAAPHATDPEPPTEPAEAAPEPEDGEQMSSDDAPAEEQPETEAIDDAGHAPAGTAPGPSRLTGLGALVDKLAGDKRLFEPLDDADEPPLPALDENPVSEPDVEDTAGVDAPAPGRENESDWMWDADTQSDEAAFAEDSGADDAGPRAGLWQLTGRGLTLPTPTREAEAETDTEQEPGDDEPAPRSAPPSSDLEQSSRYNFQELSRILTERIGPDGEPTSKPSSADAPSRSGGALVPLSDEALVLNRLPLGIAIFRDQDFLFINRTLLDTTGYPSAATLREAGPGAIFPATGNNDEVGPVTHLVRRDGTRMSVTARLQTVSWQGRHAVMLSARTVENPQFSEAEVKTFAAQCAQLEGGTMIQADPSGRITALDEYGSASGLAVGNTITAAVAESARASLLDFLAAPARFAETARPGLRLPGRRPGDALTVFVEGRAGVVAGYFGIHTRGGADALGSRGAGLAPASLKRISRELRQPLNTISGFAELMSSEAFGPLSNARYTEYARDIKAAGQAIRDLADELDDYVRITDGEQALSPSDIDLSALLADCLVRVRAQAGAARVLLRSAVSEKLPFIRADAATLKQAVLNMLASAIAETQPGSKVVLSAQREENGSVTIHVRDARKAPNALAEQFVVFRDGQARDGTARKPARSSIGLTLTRALVSANACSFALAPASETGTLMTLTVPADLVVKAQRAGN